MVIPGSLTVIANSCLSEMEITKEVSPDFVKDIYMFVLGRGEILDLREYFKNRFDYRMQGHIYSEDLVEIFIDNHRKWKIW
jgi:hypothetical protein